MRKEDLLEHALRVYLRNPKATVSEVAEEARISKSTVFYHFKNKKELEKELLIYAIRRFTPWGEERLEEAIRKRFEAMKRVPGLARMTYALIDNLSKNDPGFIKELTKKSFKRVSELLEKEGFENSKDVAIFLHALLDGIAMYSMYIDVDYDKFEKFVLKALKGLKEDEMDCNNSPSDSRN